MYINRSPDWPSHRGESLEAAEVLKHEDMDKEKTKLGSHDTLTEYNKKFSSHCEETSEILSTHLLGKQLGEHVGGNNSSR